MTVFNPNEFNADLPADFVQQLTQPEGYTPPAQQMKTGKLFDLFKEADNPWQLRFIPIILMIMAPVAIITWTAIELFAPQPQAQIEEVQTDE